MRCALSLVSSQTFHECKDARRATTTQAQALDMFQARQSHEYHICIAIFASRSTRPLSADVYSSCVSMRVLAREIPPHSLHVEVVQGKVLLAAG